MTDFKGNMQPLSLKTWKNTATLDSRIPELSAKVEPDEAECAVIGGKPIDLSKFPRLRGLFKCGVGIDNIPFDACRDRGIAVGLPSPETAGFIYEETASFAVHLILRMLYQDAGDVETWTKHTRPALDQRTVLLIGQGNIGQRVARKLRELVKLESFDAANDPPDCLAVLLARADVVSLHIPLIEENRNCFDTHKLALMKDGAILVNTARGPLVDEQALLHEIQQGRLRAAFDVFWQEPYHGPLRQFHPERFYMTPHIASANESFLDGLACDFRAFAASL